MVSVCIDILWCVHECGQMSGQVLWFVVWCAGMYVGGCNVIVWAPCKAF